MSAHGEIVELVNAETGELVPFEPPAHVPATLFRTDVPAEILALSVEIANTLEPVIRRKQLFKKIGQKDHVFVEAWTLLGTMLGVFPVCTWTRKLDDGWEARVEARTRDGAIVGAAEAQCLRSETTWKSRDDYALRSMAQTRATSKALRQPLGFVIHLAGFAATPAEEMPTGVSVEPVVVEADDRRFPPADEPVPGAGQVDGGARPMTEPMRKKLEAMVGQLRRGGHITAEQLWLSQMRDPELGRGEDGEIHWSPLRDSLTRDQASALIDRLTLLEHRVAESAGSEFQAPASVREA